MKVLIDVACDKGVPISDGAMKGWTDKMVLYYMDNWNKRAGHNDSSEQKLKYKMEIIKNRIVHLNRNLHNNAKANAEKMVKNSCDNWWQ